MKAELTEGPIPKQLAGLALPMSFGVFAIIGFNLVDTYFVGQLGSAELAAITFTFPVPMIVGSVAFGVGISVGSIVSRALGAGEEQTIREVVTDSLVLVVLLACALSVLGLATIRPFFGLLGAEGEVLRHVQDYMTIWYLNVPCVVIPMVGNSAIRAMGNTRFPALVMAVAGLVNAVLDPLLIFGMYGFPELGLRGAAIATVISRLLSLVAALYVLQVRYHVLINPLPRLGAMVRDWLVILTIAVPAFFTNLVTPIGMAVVTRMVSQYGTAVVAGFGVGSRIESFLGILLIGVSSSLGPFVGQNYGAERHDRINTALKLANSFPPVWALLCFAGVFLFSDIATAAFNPDPAVMSAARDYLLIITLGLAGKGVLDNITATFNVLGKPKISLYVNITKMVVVYLPFALVLSGRINQYGIYIAALIAHLVSGLVTYWYLQRQMSGCQIHAGYQTAGAIRSPA